MGFVLHLFRLFIRSCLLSPSKVILQSGRLTLSHNIAGWRVASLTELQELNIENAAIDDIIVERASLDGVWTPQSVCDVVPSRQHATSLNEGDVYCLPALVGVAFSKCGSTFLSEVMFEHPRVQPGNRKEVRTLFNDIGPYR